MCGARTICVRPFCLGIHPLLPLLGHAYTDKQNVSPLELDVTFVGNIHDIRELDLVLRKGCVVNAFRFRP